MDRERIKDRAVQIIGALHDLTIDEAFAVVAVVTAAMIGTNQEPAGRQATVDALYETIRAAAMWEDQ